MIIAKLFLIIKTRNVIQVKNNKRYFIKYATKDSDIRIMLSDWLRLKKYSSQKPPVL